MRNAPNIILSVALNQSYVVLNELCMVTLKRTKFNLEINFSYDVYFSKYSWWEILKIHPLFYLQLHPVQINVLEVAVLCRIYDFI